MKIGLFGGTFNPIHIGHLRGAEEVREYFELDKVIFIPSGIPALKHYEIIEGFHRLKMTELAIQDNPYFEVSDYEIKLRKPSYTVNTIPYFKKLYEGHTLLFIIGVDAFFELPRWYKTQKLLKMIDFIVMSRPGIEEIESKMANLDFIESKQSENIFKIKNSDKKIYYIEISPFWISSTILREMIKKNKSIRYLLPDKVINYIESNKLYRSVRHD
ncbi:MAG: nicotinate-nucleotide adenylyltransferase [Thermodesulfovibrio sp.]|nr:nicotinate-nucleotide adenylyltransferase [Thermodesulfovibrio sp.]